MVTFSSTAEVSVDIYKKMEKIVSMTLAAENKEFDDE